MERNAYPRDVSDDEWAFVVPSSARMIEDAPQRNYPLRAICNGVRWIAPAGAPWRMMPHDLPPWEALDQQPRRWRRALLCEAMVPALRVVLRLAEGRTGQPSTAILNSHTLQPPPQSGPKMYKVELDGLTFRVHHMGAPRSISFARLMRDLTSSYSTGSAQGGQGGRVWGFNS